MTRLLDGNVLVALAVEDHEFHDRCSNWFAGFLRNRASFATCPITEGTLLRLHMILDPHQSAAVAWRALEGLRATRGHKSWLDNFSYADLSPDLIHGHRQVSDAWLVELARRKGGKLVTLDAALATLYPQFVETIPVVL